MPDIGGVICKVGFGILDFFFVKTKICLCGRNNGCTLNVNSLMDGWTSSLYKMTYAWQCVLIK